MAVVTVDQSDDRVSFAARSVIAVFLAAAAAVQIPVIAVYWGRATWAGVVLGVVAVMALTLAIALLLVARRAMLLAAAAMGAVAMAADLVTWVLAVPQLGGVGKWTPAWGIATLVLDSLAVRAAFFTLRRKARPGTGQASRRASGRRTPG